MCNASKIRWRKGPTADLGASFSGVRMLQRNPGRLDYSAERPFWARTGFLMEGNGKNLKNHTVYDLSKSPVCRVKNLPPHRGSPIPDLPTFSLVQYSWHSNSYEPISHSLNSYPIDWSSNSSFHWLPLNPIDQDWASLTEPSSHWPDLAHWLSWHVVDWAGRKAVALL